MFQEQEEQLPKVSVDVHEQGPFCSVRTLSCDEREGHGLVFDGLQWHLQRSDRTFRSVDEFLTEFGFERRQTRLRECRPQPVQEHDGKLYQLFEAGACVGWVARGPDAKLTLHRKLFHVDGAWDLPYGYQFFETLEEALVFEPEPEVLTVTKDGLSLSDPWLEQFSQFSPPPSRLSQPSQPEWLRTYEVFASSS